MLGALLGDIAGSRFERSNIKTKNFDLLTHTCKPTDDSVMSLAVARAILECDGKPADLGNAAIRWMQEFGRRYPYAGYGGSFRRWLRAPNPKPYGSYGNGAAMRVSACGFAAKTLDDAKTMAKAVTEVTHNHPEGLKAAEAVSVAIFMARFGSSMPEIRDCIEKNYYPISFTLDAIRDSYTFNVSCQGSVPQAFEAFFESKGFEDAIRNAISIGGDSDTIAAIAGGIAEAYYGIPAELRKQALTFLDDYQLDTLNAFESKYGLVAEKQAGSEIPRPVSNT